MSLENEHKAIYRKIGERVQAKTALGELDLRTIFHQLIRLPEVYKLDFIEVHLSGLLSKCGKGRDELLLEHFRHYVSINPLAALLSKLRQSELEFGEPVIQLLEHIRNLQLMPGPSTRDRENLEQLQFDLIYLLQKHQEKKDVVWVNLSSNERRQKVAELYYDRILSSFISVDDEELLSENEFVEQLKLQLLQSESVKEFAARYGREINAQSQDFFKDLGRVLSSTIQEAYLKNYEGVFNGPRQEVLKKFKEAIEHRCLDSEDDSKVDLDKISSGILSVVLELVFNDGFGAFRNTLTQSIQKSLEESN